MSSLSAPNECGFVAGCGTVDAIHAVRLLMEKHREMQKPVHLAFLDFEAFDRVLRKAIWYVSRQHVVSEELIEVCVLQLFFIFEMDAVSRDIQQPVPTNLPPALVFMYLGSAVASDGSALVEVNSRRNAAWFKWRSLTGVLCDKKIPERPKSKIYSAVVRPVAIYGAECWPVTKEIERRLSVMETKMLRFGVTPIFEKMFEARLQCYGHVLRAEDDTIQKTGLNL
ncbi:unnamed protein product, partial [Heligmosomoides polygyrus]|uniref:3Beta_HSD domain-containing protein n=1 Tax=Heligmosomoides polygyrus TaxID=6339 RepID=A0A183G739_HELPZ